MPFAILPQLMTTSSSGPLINNTVVFAHGVGNLIIANAWNHRLCRLDSSSYWMEINVRLPATPHRVYPWIRRQALTCSLRVVSVGYQDDQPLSRIAKWNLEFCHEAANFPNATAIDAKLDFAYAKRQEYRDPNGDGSSDWGGEKKERKENKKAWRKWRKQWLREELTFQERRALRQRQNQRRVVRDTGACAVDADPTLASRLARFSFKPSPAWQYLAVVRPLPRRCAAPACELGVGPAAGWLTVHLCVGCACRSFPMTHN